MRRVSLVLLSTILLAVLLAACQTGGEAGEGCAGEGYLFVDDFASETACGWALYNQGGAEAAIEDGMMRLSTSQPGPIWWTNPGGNFDDVIVTVTARQAAGPDDNAYGVICRYQSAENFYLFLVSGDGFYAIGKYQSGNDQVQYLTTDGEHAFVRSDAINQGVATNQIRVSCVGNELSLAVNGLPLVSVTDPTFVTGDVGLGVSAFELGMAVIEFDDIQIIAP